MAELGAELAGADEAQRQADLLQALLHDAAAMPAGWQSVPGPAPQHRAARALSGGAEHADDADDADDGLQAYLRHARATAARALQAAHPVLAELVGEEALRALAWRLWQQAPPARGDLAQWGQALPGLLEARPELQDEPYLADVARLEWSVHRALTAADETDSAGAGGLLPGLALLATADPQGLRLRMRPGLAVQQSAHPLWAIWQAHQSPLRDLPERFAEVRAATAQGWGQAVVVRRVGWAVQVEALEPADAAFTLALLDGRSLGAALADAAPVDFQSWLIRALREGWLAAVEQAG